MRPCYCRATRGANDAPVLHRAARVRVHVPHRRRERECFGTRRRNYKLETFAFLFQNSQSSKYNGRSNISSSHSPEVHPQRSCELGGQGQGLVFRVFSQSVSYFTVPPRAQTPLSPAPPLPVAPGLTQVPSTRSRGLLFYSKSQPRTRHTCSFHVCVQCWLVSFLGFRGRTPRTPFFFWRDGSLWVAVR